MEAIEDRILTYDSLYRRLMSVLDDHKNRARTSTN